MNENDFANRLRSLFNIDGFLLAPELNKLEQQAFVMNQVSFYLKCNDRKRAAIWREIEKRQKENA